MYRIAIVEDDPQSIEQLKGFLDRYQRENDICFQIRIYQNGQSFIMNYKADCDVILMDVEMPYLNGIEAARKLRRIDQDVSLIFVSRILKYAIEGYEVRALDFLLKPVEYTNFSMKLKKALEMRDRTQKREIVLNVAEGIYRVRTDEIYYVEVMNHTLIYHTEQGELRERGSIKEREIMLEQYDFARCNNSYLVNMNYVRSVTAGTVVVKDRTIPIGRTKKKEFMRRLTEFMGANI